MVQGVAKGKAETKFRTCVIPGCVFLRVASVFFVAVVHEAPHFKVAVKSGTYSTYYLQTVTLLLWQKGQLKQK